MTSGASTAGSTLPTEAKVCCRNIAARAISIRDKLQSLGITSPRLRGEVGRRERRGFRGRGRVLSASAAYDMVTKMPLTPTLSPPVGRGSMARSRHRARDGVANGLFRGSYLCCRSTPGQIAHTVSFGMLFVHCSRRDGTGVARAVGTVLSAKDERDRSVEHK